MARYTGSVCRLCRREGAKLFLKGSRCYSKKCSFERRPTPPGQHGVRRRKVGGIRPGTVMTVEGVVGAHEGRLAILNPTYELETVPGHHA